MAHQAEMENHRYHCHLGLNFPLSGEPVLWNSQEEPTLEAEGAVLGFTSSASHTEGITEDPAEVLFFF